MKPNIDVVFPDIKTAKEISGAVEKIKISLRRRRMELILSADAQDDTIEKFEDELRRAFRLNGINVRAVAPDTNAFPEKQVMYIGRRARKGDRRNLRLGNPFRAYADKPNQ